MELVVKQESFLSYPNAINQKPVILINRAVKYHFKKNERIKYTWDTWEFLYDLSHYDPEYKVRISLWDIVNRIPGRISLATVKRHIRILVATGWLSIINTKTKYGKAPNIYKIGIPPHLMETISRMEDRKFKVVPTVDYSCPPSEIPLLEREGVPSTADNKDYQTTTSQDSIQIPQTISFQPKLTSEPCNISPKDNITNCSDLSTDEAPEITYTEVIQAVRVESVGPDFQDEKREEGREVDPVQEAIHYVSKFRTDNRLEGTHDEIIATLEARLAESQIAEKAATKAFEDAPGADKFKLMRVMQDKSAFTYQIKTQLESFKRMVERIGESRVSMQLEDGKMGAPEICFTPDDFTLLHQKLKKLRIKGVNFKKIMIEVIWSICFGSLRLCKRTGRDNTTAQGRRDAIEAAVYLICVRKWATPKGMLHK